MADEGLSPASSDLEQLLQQELAALSSRSDSLCTSTEASQLCLDAAGPAVTDSWEFEPSAAFQALQAALLKREQLCEQVVQTLADVQQQLAGAAAPVPPTAAAGTADTSGQSDKEAAAAAVQYYTEHAEQDEAPADTAAAAPAAAAAAAAAASGDPQETCARSQSDPDNQKPGMDVLSPGACTSDDAPTGGSQGMQQPSPRLAGLPAQDAAAGPTAHAGQDAGLEDTTNTSSSSSSIRNGSCQLPASPRRTSTAQDCRCSLEFDQLPSSSSSSNTYLVRPPPPFAAASDIDGGVTSARSSPEPGSSKSPLGNSAVPNGGSSSSSDGNGTDSSSGSSSGGMRGLHPSREGPTIHTAGLTADKSAAALRSPVGRPGERSSQVMDEDTLDPADQAVTPPGDATSSSRSSSPTHGPKHVASTAAIACQSSSPRSGGQHQASPQPPAGGTQFEAASGLALVTSGGDVEVPRQPAAPDAHAADAYLQQLEERQQQLQAALAAERDAELAAAAQLKQQQEALAAKLQQQAAATAQREAALQESAARLQQQLAATGRRHMAAWVIGRAWRRYSSSPGRGAKLRVLTLLQAHIRGWLARRQLQQVQQAGALLQQLQQALEAGDCERVEAARTAAEAAGLVSEVQQLVTRHAAAVDTVKQQLLAAAAGGSYAAYSAAVSSAGCYAALATVRAECAAAFGSRQAAASAAIAAAAAAAPLGDLEVLCQQGLDLGLTHKELRVAREAARQRDRQLAADLAAHAQASSFNSRTWEQLVERGLQLGLCAEVAMSQQELQRRKDRTAQQLVLVTQQLQTTCRDMQQQSMQQQQEQQSSVAPGAGLSHLVQSLQQAAAEAEQLGMQEAVQAAQAGLHQQKEALLALAQSAAATGSWAEVQNWVSAAAAVGVDSQQLQQVQQQVAARQQAAQQQLQEAAASGSYADVAAAAAEATSLRVEGTQEAFQSFRTRQAAAASRLGETAGVCCQALRQLPAMQLQLQVHRFTAALERVLLASSISSTGSSSSTARDTPGSTDKAPPRLQLLGEEHQLSAVAAAALQQVQQQLEGCWDLGLASGVQGVLEGLLLECRALLSKGGAVVASAALPADQCSWGGDTAWLSGTITTGIGNSSSSSSSSVSGWIAAADAGGVECVLPEEYVLGPSYTLASPQAAAAGAVGRDTGSCAGGEPAAEVVWCVQQALDHQQQQAVQWDQHQAHLQRLHQHLRPSAAAASWQWRCQLQQQQQQQQVGSPANVHVPWRLAPAALPLEQLLQQWEAMQRGLSSRQAPDGSHSPAAALPAPVQQRTCAAAPGVPPAPVAAAVPDAASKGGGAGRGVTEGLIRGIVGPGAALSALRRLDLSLEQLGSTAGLAALCPHLEVVRLANNQLVAAGGLGALTGLQELHLQDNQMQRPPALPGQQLVRLNLANNLITSLALTPVGDNSSSSIGGSATRSSSSSSSSSASGGHGTARSTAATTTTSTTSSSSCRAGCWPVLQSLDVSGNRLVELRGLPACPQLLALHLSRNQLTSLQGLEGCPVLQHLYLSGNRLAAFPGPSSSSSSRPLHLPLLQHLHLTHNRLTALPDCRACPLPHLTSLVLAHNSINQLDPAALHGLHRLQLLDLSFNQVAGLEQVAALQPLLGLRSLLLSDNPVSSRSSQQVTAYRAAVALSLPLLRCLDLEEVGWREAGAAAAAVAGAGGVQQAGAGRHQQQQEAGDAQVDPWQDPPQRQQPAAAQHMAQEQHQQQQWRQEGGLVQGSSTTHPRQVPVLAALRASAPAAVAWRRSCQQQLALGGQLGCWEAAAVALLPQLVLGVAGGRPLLGCNMPLAAAAAAAAATNTSNSSSSSSSSSSRERPGQWLADQQQLWLYSARQHLVDQQALEQQVCRVLLSLCSRAAEPELSQQGVASPREVQQLLVELKHRAAAASEACAGGTGKVPQLPGWLAMWLQQCCRALGDVSPAAAAAAARHPVTSSSDRGDTSGTDVTSITSSSRVVITAGLLAQQHLQQLLQPLASHVNRLVPLPSYHHQQQAALHVAAAVLQRAWRCRAACRDLAAARRLQQQQEAAAVLQSAWRGKAVRRQRLLEVLRAERDAAAATRIQAVVRGRRVRQRLAAALAAAKGWSAHHQPYQPQQQQQAVQPGAPAGVSAAAEAGGLGGGAWTGGGLPAAEDDLEDLEGITAEWWNMPEDLQRAAPLVPAWQPAAAAGGGGAAVPRAAVVTPGASLSSPAQQQEGHDGFETGKASSGSLAAAADLAMAGAAAAAAAPGGSSSQWLLSAEPSYATSAATAPAAAAEPSCGTFGGSVCGEGGAGAAARRAAYLAKLQALMTEWGFKDLATAEAHYKRQRHVMQHVRKAQQAAALRDPQERLRQLQKTVAARGPLQPTPPAAPHHAPVTGHTPAQQRQQHNTAGRASDASSSSGSGGGAGGSRRTSQAGRAGSTAGGGPAALQPGSARGSRHSSSGGGSSAHGDAAGSSRPGAGSTGGGLPAIVKPPAAGLALPAVSPLLELQSPGKVGEAGQGLLPAIRGAGRG